MMKNKSKRFKNYFIVTTDMVSQSKVNNPRFWKRWRDSGAVGTVTRKYWISWISGNYADEGCTKPSFKFWETGSIFRQNSERDDLTLCTLLEVPSEEAAWELIPKHFPDYEERFCNRRSDLTYEKLAEGGRFV